MPEEEVLQTEETPVSGSAPEPMEAATEAPEGEISEDAPTPEGEISEDAPTPRGEISEAPSTPEASGVVEVGAIVEGVVQRITPYGAFIQLPGGKLGLIHISEIDRNYVKDVHDHLREADTIQAKVLAIKDDGKIDLSIKALQDPQPRVERRRGSDPGFEQMLRKFMRQSEERQVDVKRSVMHKRK